MKIALAKINIDNSTQVRLGLNAEVVERYGNNYKAGIAMPDIVVFADGNDFWIGDGFHRYAGAKGAGLTEIGADVREGTRLDGILYSLTCNDKHGLPLTNADKRNGVRNILKEKAWETRSDRWIADVVKVSEKLVSVVRAELKEKTVVLHVDAKKEDANGSSGKQHTNAESRTSTEADVEHDHESPPKTTRVERMGRDGKKRAPKTPRKPKDPKKASKEAHGLLEKVVRYADSLASGKPKFKSIRDQFQKHLQAAKDTLVQLERATEVK